MSLFNVKTQGHEKKQHGVEASLKPRVNDARTNGDVTHIFDQFCLWGVSEHFDVYGHTL